MIDHVIEEHMKQDFNLDPTRETICTITSVGFEGPPRSTGAEEDMVILYQRIKPDSTNNLVARLFFLSYTYHLALIHGEVEKDWLFQLGNTGLLVAQTPEYKTNISTLLLKSIHHLERARNFSLRTGAKFAKDKRIYLALAQCYELVENYESALIAYSQSKIYWNRDPITSVRMAEIMFKLGQYSKARKKYNTAIKEGARLTDMAPYIGRCYFQLRLTELGMKWYNKAFEQQSKPNKDWAKTFKPILEESADILMHQPTTPKNTDLLTQLRVLQTRIETQFKQ